MGVKTMKNNIKKLIFPSLVLMSLALAGCNINHEPIDSNTTPSGQTDDDGEDNPSISTAVTGVSLNKTALSMLVGGTFKLEATVSPLAANNKNVTWTSSNEAAVIVEDGKVTATGLGEATITVTTIEGGFTATCVINVVEDEVGVTGVELNYDSYSLIVGDSVRLVETVLPENATNQNVTWSSSNEEIVTVENGTIKGVAAGEATITVTTVDGEFTATCVVTISEKEIDDDYVPNEEDLEMNITEEGEYNFEGEITKQIYVNAPGKKVVLNLNGVTITYGKNSPIYVHTCDSIEISAKKNKTNLINDTRATLTEEDSTQGKGAIYVADGDLKLKGTGTLTIEAGYNNGIHGKDDVKVQKMTLNITAPNHAIKGNDSIEISSGTLNLSCGGDGLKTENSDLSSKGKQRGNVDILGGTVTINSLGDGISAAYDANITEVADDEGAVEYPVSVEINTDKYSSYEGATVEKSESKFYLKLSSSLYNSYGANYTFAAYMNETFYKAAYAGSKTSSSQGWRPGPGGGGPGGGGQPGGSTTYYVYEIDKPAEATSFTLYMFSGSNVTNFSTSSYYAKSDAKTFNSYYDMIQVSSVSTYSSKISFGSWSSYDDSPSTKGIKAENKVVVDAGTVVIKSTDDGIHANNDGSLENGEKPLGNVIISGGDTVVTSGDDGVHADGTLKVLGGKLNVLTAYEGIEGNIIEISGGETYVVATDDGVNASSGISTPSITVSGGYLDVTVSPSGDTDGIDSNGTYTQTGGVVIARGPNSTNMAALDTDSTCSITGGTIIVLGALGERGISRGSGVSQYNVSLHTSGSKTVNIGGTSYTFNNSYSYGKTICYSSVSVTA